MSTADIIRPIVNRTYGDNGMSRALAIYLADKIDTFDPVLDLCRDGSIYGVGREHMIMQVCWNWFPGGTTAKNVAERIELALKEAS